MKQTKMMSDGSNHHQFSRGSVETSDSSSAPIDHKIELWNENAATASMSV
jgi:hypothetical protein